MSESLKDRLRRVRGEGERSIGGPLGPVAAPAESKERAIRLVDMIETTMERDEYGALVTDEDGRPVIQERLMRAAINQNSDPFSWLIANDRLRRKTKEFTEAPSTAEMRILAGERYRSIFEGAQVSSVRSSGFEIRAASAPGFAKHVGDHALDCIRYLKKIEMEAGERQDLLAVQLVVLRDRWIWKGAPKRGPSLEEIIPIMRGLDGIAAFFGLCMKEEVRLRWLDASPETAPQPSDRSSPSDHEG